MGLTTAEMLAVIAALSRREFYKSMTTYADHRVWQDVYHAQHRCGRMLISRLPCAMGPR